MHFKCGRSIVGVKNFVCINQSRRILFLDGSNADTVFRLGQREFKIDAPPVFGSRSFHLRGTSHFSCYYFGCYIKCIWLARINIADIPISVFSYCGAVSIFCFYNNSLRIAFLEIECYRCFGNCFSRRTFTTFHPGHTTPTIDNFKGRICPIVIRYLICVHKPLCFFFYYRDKFFTFGDREIECDAAPVGIKGFCYGDFATYISRLHFSVHIQNIRFFGVNTVYVPISVISYYGDIILRNLLSLCGNIGCLFGVFSRGGGRHLCGLRAFSRVPCASFGFFCTFQGGCCIPCSRFGRISSAISVFRSLFCACLSILCRFLSAICFICRCFGGLLRRACGGHYSIQCIRDIFSSLFTILGTVCLRHHYIKRLGGEHFILTAI